MTKRTNNFSKSLAGWVQIFAAGEQTDSAGKKKTWTEADLDQIVSNFDANDRAAMVVGHPKHDSPAFGWVGALKREGTALFAKFDEIAEQFIAWGQAGHIRNRSVKILNTPKGFRLGHVGFLGAMPPAVEGMPTLQFSDESGDVYEFGWAEAFETTLLARILRRLRDAMLGEHGQEKADALISPYDIEELERLAAEKRASNQPHPTFSHHPEPTVPNITQEQHDAAIAQVRKEEQDKHNAAIRTSQFATNLAANRAFITSLGGDEAGQVRLTPAQAEGWAECLTFAQQLEAGAASEFSFAAQDKSDKKLSVYEFLKGKLTELPTQLKLGATQADIDPTEQASGHSFSAPVGLEVDSTRLQLHARAKEYQAQHPGTTYLDAVRHLGG